MIFMPKLIKAFILLWFFLNHIKYSIYNMYLNGRVQRTKASRFKNVIRPISILAPVIDIKVIENTTSF